MPATKLRSFMGGIHPLKRKELTRERPIEPIPLPGKVVIPLFQPAGKEPRPIVSKGDIVTAGQVIAEPQDGRGVFVHSSVCGKVKKVGRFPFPAGFFVTAAEVEVGEGEKPFPPMERTPEGPEIIEIIRNAGIVGMGGAGFPTHFKLKGAREAGVEFLLVNGAECEPYLTADYRVLMERTEDLISGTKLLLKASGAKRAYVAVESDKKDAYDRLGGMVPDDDVIKPVLLRAKYPQGSEKQLIEAVLKREVPAGGLPADVGVLVQNVSTACAVHDAVAFGKPLIERVVTLSGTPLKRPGNYLVRIGTLIEDLMEAAGPDRDNIGKVIVGGPMMGFSMSRLDVPVARETTGVVLLSRVEAEVEPSHQSCVRCGKCLYVCPMFLPTSEICIAVERGDYALAVKLGLENCMECGSCAYVCPSRRPLVQWIKTAKLFAKKVKK
ncbi:MAG: electron transport complex subunit RsxC [Candidatus Tritonobacter lacicola]|nr:electron transport complex subunit RsxC [Candidatus Tritonobacter lacicola]